MSNPRDTSGQPGVWPGTNSNSMDEAGEGGQRGTTFEMREKHVDVDEAKPTEEKVKATGKKMDEVGALFNKWIAGSPIVSKKKVRFSSDAQDREVATAFSHTVHPSKLFEYIADGEGKVEPETEASGNKVLVLTSGESAKVRRQSFDSGGWIPLL